jgi:asparagine synthase (glutamine-hydrolysing)
MKYGLNPLGMSFILPFFEAIRQTFGRRTTYWTGDGGNKLQIDFHPQRVLYDVDDLTDYVISRHEIFPLGTVTALMDISEHDVRDEVRALLSSYPESITTYKYVRFYMDEKTFKWNLEGEDRNRFYFWSVTPFFSVQFFNYLIGCPEEQKSRHALYREFLLRLSPAAARVENANWGFSILSNKYSMRAFLKQLVIDKMSPRLKKKIRSIPSLPRNQYSGFIEVQLRSCESLRKYLDLGRCSQDIRTLGNTASETLLSVLCAIEQIECGKSTFEQYLEATFS